MFFFSFVKKNKILALFSSFWFTGRKRINNLKINFPLVGDTPLSADWSTKSEPVTSSSVPQNYSPLLLYGAGPTSAFLLCNLTHSAEIFISEILISTQPVVFSCVKLNLYGEAAHRRRKDEEHRFFLKK